MRLAVFSLVTLIIFPAVAFAFPFGGQASQVIFCYNQAIYAYLGPPRGGSYIWVQSTKTYNFGPPARAGQWLLGLASAPYYCLVTVSPVTVQAGIVITMMGSSGPSAPGTTYTKGGSAGFTAQPSASDYSALLNSGKQGISSPTQ